MTIGLLTDGMLCGISGGGSGTPCAFSPIEKFEVSFLLRAPAGFLASGVEEIGRPLGFLVELLDTGPLMPKGVMIETEAAVSAPAGFDAEDLDYVASPAGFSVEDIP